jgi:hypothetical protein
MTQSGQPKKPLAVEPVSEVKETPKKEALIEELKAKKPDVYEQYVAAAKAKRPVWVYPDLTVRIG